MPDGRRLRFHVPGQAVSLPTPAERAERERARADAAEDEVRRLKAELEALRRDDG